MNVVLDVKYFKTMIKKEWQFMQNTMSKKKLIQKLQQLFDKLPKGEERKALRKRLLNLKLNKNQK